MKFKAKKILSVKIGENLTTLLKGMEKELDCIGKLSIY